GVRPLRAGLRQISVGTCKSIYGRWPHKPETQRNIVIFRVNDTVNAILYRVSKEFAKNIMVTMQDKIANFHTSAAFAAGGSFLDNSFQNDCHFSSFPGLDYCW